MSRYTQRDEYGNADIIGVDSADLQLNLEFKEFNRVTDALNRLAAYEDAEEQGLLVVLPCKVGSDFYDVHRGGDKPLTPCDLCIYDPPSSLDGKPCKMCPASSKPDMRL